MATTLKVKYHEKVKVCTTAMESAETTLRKIGLPNNVASKYVIALGELADALRDTRLKVQPVRTILSMEERSRRRLIKIHEKHIARTISWLKTDGIKKGAPGQRRRDGAHVVFTGDPIITTEGIRISVHFTETDERVDKVDPMQFMPDISVPAVSPTKHPARKPAAALKTAPAKSAAAK